MSSIFKNIVVRFLLVSAVAASAMHSANAVVLHRLVRVVPYPVAAPVVAAPVVAAPVVAAPVVAAPIVAAPVVALPVCQIVSVPVVNAYTGVTFFVPRRVCN